MRNLKVSGTSEVIDGKYYFKEVLYGIEKLHETNMTVVSVEKAKAGLKMFVDGMKKVDAGEMTMLELAEKYLKFHDKGAQS